MLEGQSTGTHDVRRVLSKGAQGAVNGYSRCSRKGTHPTASAHRTASALRSRTRSDGPPGKGNPLDWSQCAESSGAVPCSALGMWHTTRKKDSHTRPRPLTHTRARTRMQPITDAHTQSVAHGRADAHARACAPTKTSLPCACREATVQQRTIDRLCIRR